MQTRTWSSGAYRFGFNGKEKDNEFNVNDGSYDFGARIYDGRLGRWLSVDPLYAKYADLSPFNFTGNNPILFIDPDGKKIDLSQLSKPQKREYKAMIRQLKKSDIFRDMYKQLNESESVVQIHASEKNIAKGSVDNKTTIKTTIDLGSKTVVVQELFHSYQDIKENRELYKGATQTDNEVEGEVATNLIMKQINSKTKNRNDYYDPMGAVTSSVEDGKVTFNSDPITSYSPKSEEIKSEKFNSDYQNYKKVFVNYHKTNDENVGKPGGPAEKSPASYRGPITEKKAVGLSKLISK